MKNFFVSKKGLIGALAASTLLVLPFTASELTARKINSVQNLSAGSTTCFTRVGQTFTALMIGDYGSSYLAKEFITTSGDCFAQLNKSFEGVFATSFVEAKKPLNKLSSDLFWFHEKTEKLAQMVKNGETELSVNSNILTKFSSLEALNLDFQEKLEAKLSSLEDWRVAWSALAMIGAFAVAALALLTGRARQKEVDSFEHLNLEAKDILEKSSDVDMVMLKAGRLMENLFSKINAPFCYELYNKVQTDLLDSKAFDAKTAYEEAPVKKNLDAYEGEVTEFGVTTRALVDRLNDKIFTHGIILDQNLDEDFLVKGNSESLEQLLYNLFAFAIENSLHHNSGRKISMKSKALGGVSYLKIKIANYLLNPSEMELFNGAEPSRLANVNLVLMKEIATDLNASVAAKNILNSNGSFNGAEIEIVFQRVANGSKKTKGKASASKKGARLSNVMKGSKKDILKALRSEV